MDEARYKLVFEGQVAPEIPTDTVKANLARLFKCDLSRIEPLFNSKMSVLKRGLSEQEAKRYVQALRVAGAEVRMEREQPPQSDAAPVQAKKRSDSWAKIISFCAFALWFSSLPFTVFLLENGEKWSGAAILLIGWLGILSLQFAWFANIFFLYACIKIHFGSKPVLWSVIIAIILSFDSFRLAGPEMGSHSVIDGYGWGFVLWFSSLFMLVAAAGIQWVNDVHDLEMRNLNIKLLKLLGIIVVIFPLCLSLFLNYYDRSQGNSEEKTRLDRLAFKRSPVCTTEPPPYFAQPLITGSGPIEIRRLSSGNFLQDPFNSVAALLSWGIPIVRVNGRDFSYIKLGCERILTSYPVESSALAIIDINNETIVLREGETGRVLFEQTWTKQGRKFCPSFSTSTSPREYEQPRKFIIEALVDHKIEAIEQQPSDSKPENIMMEIISNEPMDSPRPPSKHPEFLSQRRKPLWQALQLARTSL
jgi:hypothetical protein